MDWMLQGLWIFAQLSTTSLHNFITISSVPQGKSWMDVIGSRSILLSSQSIPPFIINPMILFGVLYIRWNIILSVNPATLCRSKQAGDTIWKSLSCLEFCCNVQVNSIIRYVWKCTKNCLHVTITQVTMLFIFQSMKKKKEEKNILQNKQPADTIQKQME